jgi:hypothetical protein
MFAVFFMSITLLLLTLNRYFKLTQTYSFRLWTNQAFAFVKKAKNYQ